MAISYKPLWDILHDRGISLKVLEIMSGVNHGTLSVIYSNDYEKNYMSLKSLEKIARCLNVKPGELFELKV